MLKCFWTPVHLMLLLSTLTWAASYWEKYRYFWRTFPLSKNGNIVPSAIFLHVNRVCVHEGYEWDVCVWAGV